MTSKQKFKWIGFISLLCFVALCLFPALIVQNHDSIKIVVYTSNMSVYRITISYELICCSNECVVNVDIVSSGIKRKYIAFIPDDFQLDLSRAARILARHPGEYNIPSRFGIHIVKRVTVVNTFGYPENCSHIVSKHTDNVLIQSSQERWDENDYSSTLLFFYDSLSALIQP